MSPEKTAEPIVIFDGVCGLCNAFVRRVLQHDARGELVFTPNGSPFGAALSEKLQLTEESKHTILVVQGDRVLRRSDAIVFIAGHLKPPHSCLTWIRFIPRPIRDIGYRLVAAVRRLIPFNHEACELLPPELQRRIRES
jgi:predicted DCC family thiol-disulfide oxidoreductase YuxK